MTSVFFAFLYILIFFKVTFEDLCIIFEKKILVAIAVVVGEIARANFGRLCQVECQEMSIFLKSKKTTVHFGDECSFFSNYCNVLLIFHGILSRLMYATNLFYCLAIFVH